MNSTLLTLRRFLLLLIVFVMLPVKTFLFAQALQIKPYKIISHDFSKEEEQAFNTRLKRAQEIWSSGIKFNDLGKEDKAIINSIDETVESYWDIIGSGCSWYCGGGPMQVTASSSLKPQGKISYEAKNAHDLSYETAWVEGKNGYGEGEYLSYYFGENSPRITEIIIVNGYVKSKAAWQNNSRVKQLRLYFNEKYIADLHLEDKMASQYFKVPTLGFEPKYGEEKGKEWHLKFEIIEAYKGEKYDDTALTEIYFDGLDVHCFGEGTKIRMADGSEKNIESINTGDKVLSFDTNSKEITTAEVLQVATPTHCKMVEITFEDGTSIISTEDHPYLSSDETFLAVNDQKSLQHYALESIGELTPGAMLKGHYNDLKVKSIRKFHELTNTYSITQLSNGNAFLANGVWVSTAPLLEELEAFMAE